MGNPSRGALERQWPGDRPTDRSAADTLIEGLIAAGLGYVFC